MPIADFSIPTGYPKNPLDTPVQDPRLPGRVPEPRVAPRTAGQFAGPYEESWTDWPTNLAQKIADTFVDRFGGSNISRRNITESARQAEDVALSPATGATKAYAKARAGSVGEAAKEAALAAADAPGFGKAAGMAGIFISPGFLSKFPGARPGDAARIVGEAEKLRGRGISDKEILRRTHLSFLRDRGPDPAEVTPAYELPTRSLTYQMPQYERMHELNDVDRLLNDPRARGASPKVGDIIKLGAYYRLFPEMERLPAVIDESIDQPLSLLWQGEPGYTAPAVMAFNPNKFGREGEQISQFPSDRLLMERRNPTLFNIGREFQLHAAQQSGFPTIIPGDAQLARDIGHMPPTFASGSPDMARVLEGLHDEIPVPWEDEMHLPENQFNRAEVLGREALSQTTGEAIGRLGGYRMPLDTRHMLGTTPEMTWDLAGDVPMVNQLDPQALYGYAKDWGGVFPDDRMHYWEDYIKYRLSPASWDTRTGEAFRRKK